jgi:hypothetical protein
VQQTLARSCLGARNARWSPFGSAISLGLLALLVPVGVLVGGCGAGKNMGLGGDDTAELDGGADGDDGSGDSGGTGEAQPIWWTLSGTLLVAEDESLTVAESSLSIELQDVDRAPLCAEQVPLVSATHRLTEPDPLILSWWSLSLGEGDGGCVGLVPDLPSSLFVGVGELHPDVRAAQGGDASLSEAAWAHLNGAYVSFDAADTIYAFGVAGLDEAYAGLEGPVSSAPLPAGAWTLSPVFPFAY